MPAFNWPRFLTAHRIEWTDHGPSVTRGNISCHCPWCGNADQSSHLAISLEGRGYRCFRVRSKQHSGKSVPKLIQALINCSWDEACRLAGQNPSNRDFVAEQDLGSKIAALVGPARPAAPDAKPLSLLPEFRPLSWDGAGRRFAGYLCQERGYEQNDIEYLHEDYRLYYALTGPFQWRLIFPIPMFGKLINWTGRHISPNATLRYRTLSADPEKAKESGLPPAVLSVERTLFNYDNIAKGGHELMIAEGPMDAMRLDYFGAPSGVRSTCTYTKGISDAQIQLLEGLRDKFDRFTRVLDADAELDLLGEQQRLAHLYVGIKRLPYGYKDPALLPYPVALNFMGI